MVLTEARPSFTLVRVAVLPSGSMRKSVTVFDFNGAVDAEIGSCSSRQDAREADIHEHGSVDRSRIDAQDFAWNHTVVRIDPGGLAQRNKAI
jgi:hypothetical protein